MITAKPIIKEEKTVLIFCKYLDEMKKQVEVENGKQYPFFYVDQVLMGNLGIQ